MPFDLVGELISVYKPPSPNIISRMEITAKSIPEDAREDVFNAILEEQAPNFVVGVHSIVAACKKLGVPYRETHYIPTVDWTCDNCGRQFKYHPAPSDDDRIDKYIYDFCPDCGLKPYYTILAQDYNRLGIATPWYQKYLAEASQWGPRTKRVEKMTHMGGKWPIGGLYWSIDSARAERKEQKQIEINAKMAEIDRSKRWDIEP